MKASRRNWSSVCAGITAAVAVATVAAASPALGSPRAWPAVSGAITPESAGKAPQVRVNQVGYATAAPKVAYVMLARPTSKVSFEVTTPYGVAYRGTSTADVGSWNAGYRA